MNYIKKASLTLFYTGILLLIFSFLLDYKYHQSFFIGGFISIIGGFILDAIRIGVININENKTESSIIAVSYNVEYEGLYLDEDENFDAKHPIKFSNVILYDLNKIPDYDNDYTNFMSYIEDYVHTYVKENSLAEEVQKGNYFLDIVSITRL